eukprot:665827-Alexandrium_andersonii.AAC.1
MCSTGSLEPRPVAPSAALAPATAAPEPLDATGRHSLALATSNLWISASPKCTRFGLARRSTSPKRRSTSPKRTGSGTATGTGAEGSFQPPCVRPVRGCPREARRCHLEAAAAAYRHNMHGKANTTHHALARAHAATH